jgi:hypothetical protein
MDVCFFEHIHKLQTKKLGNSDMSITPIRKKTEIEALSEVAV